MIEIDTSTLKRIEDEDINYVKPSVASRLGFGIRLKIAKRTLLLGSDLIN